MISVAWEAWLSGGGDAGGGNSGSGGGGGGGGGGQRKRIGGDGCGVHCNCSDPLRLSEFFAVVKIYCRVPCNCQIQGCTSVLCFYIATMTTRGLRSLLASVGPGKSLKRDSIVARRRERRKQ